MYPYHICLNTRNLFYFQNISEIGLSKKFLCTNINAFFYRVNSINGIPYIIVSNLIFERDYYVPWLSQLYPRDMSKLKMIFFSSRNNQPSIFYLLEFWDMGRKSSLSFLPSLHTQLATTSYPFCLLIISQIHTLISMPTITSLV